MLAVRVYLLNDAGNGVQIVAEDETIDSAVAAAEIIARYQYRDESFVMTDWEAA